MVSGGIALTFLFWTLASIIGTLGCTNYTTLLDLVCHRDFLRPKICHFPQFTANFIYFLETVLVFTIFEPTFILEVTKFRKPASYLSITFT